MHALDDTENCVWVDGPSDYADFNPWPCSRYSTCRGIGVPELPSEIEDYRVLIVWHTCLCLVREGLGQSAGMKYAGLTRVLHSSPELATPLSFFRRNSSCICFVLWGMFTSLIIVQDLNLQAIILVEKIPQLQELKPIKLSLMRQFVPKCTYFCRVAVLRGVTTVSGGYNRLLEVLRLFAGAACSSFRPFIISGCVFWLIWWFAF